MSHQRGIINRIKALAVATAMFSSVTSFAQKEISTLFAVHRPYRISFTNTGSTKQSALQMNVIYKHNFGSVYYEGTYGVGGDQRNEIGSITSIVDNSRRKVSGYCIYFSAGGGQQFIVPALSAIHHYGAHDIQAELYMIIGAGETKEFMGLSYQYKSKKYSVSIRQGLLIHQVERDISLPEVEKEKTKWPTQLSIDYHCTRITLSLQIVFDVPNEGTTPLVALGMKKICSL